MLGFAIGVQHRAQQTIAILLQLIFRLFNAYNCNKTKQETVRLHIRPRNTID